MTCIKFSQRMRQIDSERSYNGETLNDLSVKTSMFSNFKVTDTINMITFKQSDTDTIGTCYVFL